MRILIQNILVVNENDVEAIIRYVETNGQSQLPYHIVSTVTYKPNVWRFDHDEHSSILLWDEEDYVEVGEITELRKLFH